MSLTKNINIGLVGAGNIAQEYLKVIKDLKNVRCAAIFSRTPSRVKPFYKKYQIGKICYSIEEFLNQDNLDGIIIAINSESVLKVLKNLKNKKIPIMIEKPVGINFSESLLIKKLISKYKNNIFVALNRRFYSSTIKAKKIISNESSKRFIKITDQQNQKHKSQILNSNLMYANSIHLIDFISVFARGKITKIKKIKKYKKNKFHEIITKIYFSSQDEAIYYCNWNSPGSWSLDIIQNKQRCELKPLEDLTHETINNKNRIIRTKFLRDKKDNKYKPGFYLMVKNFENLIKGKTNTIVKFTEYFKTVNLIKKIYE
jgi:predicted dehydrogenase